MNVGECFEYSADGNDHVYTLIVIKAGFGVAVNASSVRDKKEDEYDTTCVLCDGDHDNIHHDSWVVYEKPLINRTQWFIDYKANNPEKMRTTMNADIFQRVRDGAKNSESFPPQWYYLVE